MIETKTAIYNKPIAERPVVTCMSPEVHDTEPHFEQVSWNPTQALTETNIPLLDRNGKSLPPRVDLQWYNPNSYADLWDLSAAEINERFIKPKQLPQKQKLSLVQPVDIVA